MSDLVGNPEDRFSRVTAQMLQADLHAIVVCIYEPRREKTGLRGFRPGPTQTGLYKLRKELVA